MDVGDGADELSEDALDFGDGEGPVLEEVVVELIAWGKSAGDYHDGIGCGRT